MGERQDQRPQTTPSSRLGMRATGGGEIVEVQGGHIVRSTGRKDRHSKVCTAKGPRDRRVRLSAHTAIQFYDVQDRLGYDRPSKAVDWLIKKAKAAIDDLAELPAWKPTASNSNDVYQKQQEQEHHQLNQIVHTEAGLVGGGGRISEFQPPQLSQDDNSSSKYKNGDSAFLPPTLMVVAAEETTTTTTTTSSFQNYPPLPDLLSRTTSGAGNQSRHQHLQDLRLSLQSFQDPILLHHNHHQQHVQEQVFFAGTTTLGFDGISTGWSEQQHQQEVQENNGRFQRMVAWNNSTAASDAGSGGHGGGFIFNSPASVAMPLQAVFGHGQFFSQRGPLQSNNTPTIRAWINPSSIGSASAAVDHNNYQNQYLSPAAIHQVQASMGFAGGSSSAGFSGFHVPAQIQGEEEHDGLSDKPSSASSGSRH